MDGAWRICFRRGHFKWTVYGIQPVEGGWVVAARCDLGDHYLMPGPDGIVSERAERHIWPAQRDAERALDQFAHQHEQRDT
ncbi:MAG TPA: hypothetical protein VGN32_11570 [Ktedonobacterales bacterium]|jgi:hypothetical protein|nr:hypothetical protein [Ktedonobacterales bacterium]